MEQKHHIEPTVHQAYSVGAMRDRSQDDHDQQPTQLLLRHVSAVIQEWQAEKRLDSLKMRNDFKRTETTKHTG